jgi:hypothetical protein
LRTSHADTIANLGSIRQERLVEHGTELPDLARERILVFPGQARVEDVAGDALNVCRDAEVEDVKVFVLGLEEFARVDGVDDAAGVLECAALACAILATGPASVDEPAGSVGGLHALGKHLCIARWLGYVSMIG